MVAIALISVAFLVAAVSAVAMGYAIQRGGTCMVAAVDEVVSRGRFNRLLALAEATLWVTACLFVSHLLGAFTAPSAGFSLTAVVVLRRMLLGAGALINRACVFGA